MADNIDLNRVREAYANMHDEEILHFAKQEGLSITADAFLLLREELRKRNIGADILRELEHEIILQDSLRRKKLSMDAGLDLFSEAVNYSLSQKEQGATNYDIYAGLVEKGVSEEYSSHMVNKLEEWAKDLGKDATSETQAGLFILGIGVIAFFIAYKIDHFYLAAAMVPIIGIVIIIMGATKKHKSQKILESIKADEERMNTRQ